MAGIFRRKAALFVVLVGSCVSIPTNADEAPTILIEDAVLNCTADDGNASMPNVVNTNTDLRVLERRLHSQIARLCQGKTVCRIAADPLMDIDIQQSGCDDLVIVPVCAAGALESVNPYTSSEMTLLFRPGADVVINCDDIASPHF